MENIINTAKLNYCVGHYWECDKAISTYTYGKETFYGTIEDAENFLKYVKEVSPTYDWKIFEIKELK